MNMYICNKLKLAITSSLIVGGIIFLSATGKIKYPILNVVYAEIKSYSAEGIAMCSFGENDPQIVSAIQAARDKVGVYIRNYTKTVNSILSEGSILSIQNLIVDTIDVKYQKMPIAVENDVGFGYTATVTVKIDTNSISDYLKKNYEQRQQLEMSNKGLQQSIDENNKTFDEISKYSANAKTQEEMNNIKKSS